MFKVLQTNKNRGQLLGGLAVSALTYALFSDKPKPAPKPAEAQPSSSPVNPSANMSTNLKAVRYPNPLGPGHLTLWEETGADQKSHTATPKP